MEESEKCALPPRIEILKTRKWKKRKIKNKKCKFNAELRSIDEDCKDTENATNNNDLMIIDETCNENNNNNFKLHSLNQTNDDNIVL